MKYVNHQPSSVELLLINEFFLYGLILSINYFHIICHHSSAHQEQ